MVKNLGFGVRFESKLYHLFAVLQWGRHSFLSCMNKHAINDSCQYYCCILLLSVPSTFLLRFCLLFCWNVMTSLLVPYICKQKSPRIPSDTVLNYVLSVVCLRNNSTAFWQVSILKDLAELYRLNFLLWIHCRCIELVTHHAHFMKVKLRWNIFLKVISLWKWAGSR